jgi:glucose/mannose-6-phosphate isomerase
VRLDDIRELEALDRHDTRGVLAEFPEQCRRARALTVTPAFAGPRPRVVVIAGMGGSAAAGDVVAACATDTLDVPVVVHRGYGLPAAASRDALVLAMSYSGDTAEVLSATETALERQVAVVAITAGGALGALAESRHLPLVTLPRGLMPRMALGYLLVPALRILAHAGAPVVDDGDIEEALGVLAGQAEALGPARPCGDNEAKRLALALGNRLPAIYGGPLTAAAAYRWKTDFEENAKVLAVAGAVPEMNHNEIETWRTSDACSRHLLLLRDKNEAPEIAGRFRLLEAMLRPTAGGVDEVWAHGRSRLSRLLSLAYTGQWVSYYLAILRGIDPWPVPVLDEVKRRLARGLGDS